MIEVRAAGGIVRNDRGEVLMIFRRGVWDLPKGKVEDGEAVEAAALREVSEETGIGRECLELGAKVGETLHEYDTYGPWERKRTEWFLIKTTVTELGEITALQLEEGITEVRWIAAQVHPEPIWDNIKKLIYETDLTCGNDDCSYNNLL